MNKNISKSFCYLFIISALTTETVGIDMGGVAAYPYHFFAVAVFFLQIKYVKKLIKSPLFLLLFILLLINIISAMLSDDPYSAFLSLSRLAANMGVAFATALILLGNKISIENEYRLIIFITTVAVFFAIIQVFSYSKFGINLALSESQEEQIRGGFGPAFRYEANTFAKYLNFVFLIFFPQLIRKKNNFSFLIFFSLIIIGMLLSFTRSAQYGLAITLIFIFFWYWYRGQSSLISIKFISLFVIVGIFVVVYSNFVSDINAYAGHKIANYFSEEEILRGNSSGLRLELQDTTLSAFLKNEKTIFFGNGWGQVFYYLGDRKMQPGGAELIVMLGYGGLFSGILYIFYTFTAFLAAQKLALMHKNEKIGRIYEGFMFAIIGSFVTGQINGALIAAEYWIMIGTAIYFSYEANRKFYFKSKYK